MLLQVESLTVRYGLLTALTGVCLDIGRGEIVAVVGANGAGKTTLLSAISGLLPIAEGRIRLAGEDLVGKSSHYIVTRGVVHIPEGRRLFPFMTVAENLDMGAYSPRCRNKRASKLEHVFALLPVLRERRRQLAFSLSGGEQQMCAIGRGLMADPRVLLLDEPTLGLAPILTEELFQLVSKIREQGTTIVIVEQHVDKALRIADRGYVLDRGQVVMTGTGNELLANERLRAAYLGA